MFCAGVSKIQECQEFPTETFSINLEGVIYLAEMYRKSGAFVIYLSSEDVFSGRETCYQAHEPTAPLTEYGRQKSIVEDFLLENLLTETAIIRLGKIIDPDYNLFQYCKDQLSQNRAFLRSTIDGSHQWSSMLY